VADIFTKQKRSQIMAMVKGKETQPEIAVRKLLFSKGFRYRKNVKYLPGSPDIVLPKYYTVVFVHGCFWHGHKNCKAAALPKSRPEYWLPKINKNKNRDAAKARELRKLGWRVITIWECGIKKLMIEGSPLQKMLFTSLKERLSKSP
jgi:DNA mismatch endonuclease (patch repair protein)